jgi:hypothetical protein
VLGDGDAAGGESAGVGELSGSAGPAPAGATPRPSATTAINVRVTILGGTLRVAPLARTRGADGRSQRAAPGQIPPIATLESGTVLRMSPIFCD